MEEAQQQQPPEPGVEFDFDDPWGVLDVPKEQREDYLRELEATLESKAEEPAAEDAPEEGTDDTLSTPPPPEAQAPEPASGPGPSPAELEYERQRNLLLQEALLRLAQQQRGPAPEAPPLPDPRDDPEGYVDAVLEQRISAAVEPLKRQNQELREAYNADRADQKLRMSEAQALATYPDFAEVVAPVLPQIKAQPALAKAIRETEDPASTLYHYARGLQQDTRIEAAKREAEASTQKRITEALRKHAGSPSRLAGAGTEPIAQSEHGLEQLDGWSFYERWKNLDKQTKDKMLRGDKR